MSAAPDQVRAHAADLGHFKAGVFEPLLQLPEQSELNLNLAGSAHRVGEGVAGAHGVESP